MAPPINRSDAFGNICIGFCLCALTLFPGCAASGSSEAMASCLAQQQAMRTQMAALENRIERLEALLAAASAARRSEGVPSPETPLRLGPSSGLPQQERPQPKADDASPFGLALQHLNQRPAIEGADDILELVKRHPDHPEAPHALFQSAESLFRARELVLADWTYEKVIHDWPESD